MTREEALKILKEDGCGHCTWQSTNPYECENKECEVKEALDMAIKALSQEPCETSTDEPMTMVYPTIVCDDAISREAVIEKAEYRITMRETQNGYIEKRGYFVNVDDIRQLPSVQPRYDDAISRPLKIGDEIYIHANVNEIRADYIICENKGGYFGTVREEIYPSVQPSRKGHWLNHILSIECSECKQKFFADDEKENCQDYDACEDFNFNYCPNCGAKMVEPQESENT